MTDQLCRDDDKLRPAERQTRSGPAGRPGGAGGEPSEPVLDLESPEWILNRELTWLAFNGRVLQEAADPRTPLLERVKFLAIVSGNLDEFFMKRIGRLKNLTAAGRERPSPDGLTPAEQIAACRASVAQLKRKREAVVAEVLGELHGHGIGIVAWQDLDQPERDQLRDHYVRNIFPLVTPLAMDPGHPFPFISNLALNLLVTMGMPGERDVRLARVKVPASAELAPRLQRVGESRRLVLLEDIMANNLDLLFPGMQIDSCSVFRVTRNARTDLDGNEPEDLLEHIETAIAERAFQGIVRLQVADDMDAVQEGMLTAELGLEAGDVFRQHGMIAMQDLSEIASLKVRALHDPPHHPVDHPRLAKDQRKIFHIIRDGGPILLQHPYDSFKTSVERLLRTASVDPKVQAIKMTLYRTSAEGNIIEYLIDAARNGKQVAVLIELQARFDEAANIRWARRLEEVGIHVTYGVLGLKTHTKIILVVRRDYNGIQRYAHVGTGNYHPGTARLYSDLGLLTCDADIGADLTELFNFLTGYAALQSFRKILVAPHTLKRGVLEKIEREITTHSPDAPGHIQFKSNALEDPDVVRALYRASQAGVRVDLITRDTCCLRPGIPGLSDNVRVVSIVGRFLEHARVYYFRNGGEEEYYIGSADLMRRNLGGRVEVLVPVEDKPSRDRLRLALDVQMSDRRSAWDMQPDGSYVQRRPAPGDSAAGTHETMIRLAGKRPPTGSGDVIQPRRQRRPGERPRRSLPRGNPRR